MLNFFKYSEHHFDIGGHNVVYGFEYGLSPETVQEKIAELFPIHYTSLNNEIHLNFMMVKDLHGVVQYLPLVEICFVPEKEKGIIHVHLKKRDPMAGHVIFKDSDSFYGNDKQLDKINAELIGIIVKYYEFIDEQHGANIETYST